MKVSEVCERKLQDVANDFYKAYQLAEQWIEDGEYLQAANTLEGAGKKAMFDDFQFAIFDSATMSKN